MLGGKRPVPRDGVVRRERDNQAQRTTDGDRAQSHAAPEQHGKCEKRHRERRRRRREHDVGHDPDHENEGRSFEPGARRNGAHAPPACDRAEHERCQDQRAYGVAHPPCTPSGSKPGRIQRKPLGRHGPERGGERRRHEHHDERERDHFRQPRERDGSTQDPPEQERAQDRLAEIGDGEAYRGRKPLAVQHVGGVVGERSRGQKDWPRARGRRQEDGESNPGRRPEGSSDGRTEGEGVTQLASREIRQREQDSVNHVGPYVARTRRGDVISRCDCHVQWHPGTVEYRDTDGPPQTMSRRERSDELGCSRTST